MVISVIQFSFAFFLLIILKFKTLWIHIIWTSWAHVYSVKDIQILPIPISPKSFSVPSTVICRKEAWTPGLDHVYREVFCRLGSTLGPGFITMKPEISRFVTNKGSRQPKSRWSLHEKTLSHRVGGNRKRLYTIEERRSKIAIKRVFDCHLSPHWRQMAIENTVSIEFWSAFVDCW